MTSLGCADSRQLSDQGVLVEPVSSTSRAKKTLTESTAFRLKLRSTFGIGKVNLLGVLAWHLQQKRSPSDAARPLLLLAGQWLRAVRFTRIMIRRVRKNAPWPTAPSVPKLPLAGRAASRSVSENEGAVGAPWERPSCASKAKRLCQVPIMHRMRERRGRGRGRHGDF